MRGLGQHAGFGQKRVARQMPCQIVFHAVFVQNFVHAGLQAALGLFGGKAEVELNLHAAGNDVGGARAAADIGNLEAGGGEIGIAFVPLDGG